ncbi:MAG: CHAD domain-containing protein [Phycisphaerae bacterium]
MSPISRIAAGHPPSPNDMELDSRSFSPTHMRQITDHLYRRLSLMRGYLLAAGVDPDERIIHDLRVATRRTTEALAILAAAGSIPQRRARHCIRRLRQLRRAAGGIRDIDVFLQNLQTTGRKTADLDDARRRAIIRSLQKQRREALKVLNRYWKQAAADAELHRVVDGTRALDLHVDPKMVEKAIRLRLAWHRRRFDRRTRRSNMEPTPHHIHRTRIAGKQWRYLLEFMHAIHAAPEAQLNTVLRRLKAFQKAAGDLQDTVALQSRLRTPAQETKPPPQVQRRIHAALKAMQALR